MTSAIEASDRTAQRHRSYGNHPRNIEQRRPCGESGQLKIVGWYGAHGLGSPAPDLSDCRAWRDPERPWLLTIWEPLPTKAPAPPKAQPFCCYLNTIILYHAPYIGGFSRPWRGAYGRLQIGTRGSFVEWDRMESRLTWDDVLVFEGEEFIKGGGSVLWAGAYGERRGWWMCHGARRRVRAEERD